MRDEGLIVGEAVEVTAFVSTPESALQQYAHDFPAVLSANAARRYRALSRQMERAAEYVAAQAPGPDSLTLPAYIAQVALAHAQVKYGVTERPGKPKPLTFPRFEKPRVSIVIPAHNKFWVTYNCLAALLLAPNETTAEVIVVDDGSSDQTVDLAEIVSGVTVLRNETALGFIKSSNRGAEAARGEFVVMLNNDTEPCAGWLDELIYVFETFDDVGLAGAKLIYPNGKLQEAGGIIFPISRRLELRAQAAIRTTALQLHPPGRLLLRRLHHDARARCGDKLERLRRILRAGLLRGHRPRLPRPRIGLKTYYTPFAEIMHFEGVSSGMSTASGVKRYQAINEPKFRSRWAPTIRAQAPGAIAPDLAKDRGVALRALVIDARDAAARQGRRQLRRDPGDAAVAGAWRQADLRPAEHRLSRQLHRGASAHGRRMPLRAVQHLDRGPDPGAAARSSISSTSPAIPSRDALHRRHPPAAPQRQNRILQRRSAFPARGPRRHRRARSRDDGEGAETRETELEVMRRADVTLSYTETEAAVIISHNLDTTR